MQCPNTGQSCPNPSMCKNGCIYDKMSKKSGGKK